MENCNDSGRTDSPSHDGIWTFLRTLTCATAATILAVTGKVPGHYCLAAIFCIASPHAAKTLIQMFGKR
jgi:hypothetical protein